MKTNPQNDVAIESCDVISELDYGVSSDDGYVLIGDESNSKGETASYEIFAASSK